MPDIQQNRAEYPQQKGQKPGIGFPIARAIAVLALATASVIDLAFGPYEGKQNSETALLRQIAGSLHAGDVAVVNRYYCSFMVITLLLAQRTQTCAKTSQASQRFPPRQAARKL